jgi:hypothetical protein
VPLAAGALVGLTQPASAGTSKTKPRPKLTEIVVAKHVDAASSSLMVALDVACAFGNRRPPPGSSSVPTRKEIEMSLTDNHNKTLVADVRRGIRLGKHSETLVAGNERSGRLINHSETLLAAPVRSFIATNHIETLLAAPVRSLIATNHSETLLAVGVRS